MICVNCGHKLEEFDKNTSFLQKYKTLRNGLSHKRHQWRKFIPLRRCHCGCRKPMEKKE